MASTNQEWAQFRVLFRERDIKAVFSCWDFWVPNCVKIPQICCGRCQPTIVCCCLFVFIWGFIHLFFETSMGIFMFCVVLCLGQCMHSMCATFGQVWVNSTNPLQQLPLFMLCLGQCACSVHITFGQVWVNSMNPLWWLLLFVSYLGQWCVQCKCDFGDFTLGECG